MDFDWDLLVKKREETEKSRRNILKTEENIEKRIEEEENSKVELKRSRESVKSADSASIVKDKSYESLSKMCEHHRGSNRQGNLSERFYPSNFMRQNNSCEHGNVDSRRDDQGNSMVAFDENENVDGTRRNCKSGINISVVSRREPKSDQIEAEKPMYSISFKCCYDNKRPKSENKRRKILPLHGGKSKKFKVQENRNETMMSEETGNNHCCALDNCCNNCEAYIVEFPNDCNAYKNWRNSNFESRNVCLEDCCCPHDNKVCSPNLNVLPRRSCVNCSENRKCYGSTIEPKYDFLRDNCPIMHSKHCLHRVHFAKGQESLRKNHSSCSFCSRKCTPSKASLFVEIGESVADVCNLNSTQALHCGPSVTSFTQSADRMQSANAKKNRSDLLRSRPAKRSIPKCNPNCKGISGAIARSHSDRLELTEAKMNDCNTGKDEFRNEMLRNAKSTVSFQEVKDFRAQTESNMYINKNTADCNLQCETDERSLWGDIRNGKVWTQLQDTCRSFVKVAANSFDQIVKQSSKLKRSKKCAKDCFTCGTNTKECEKSIFAADQCNQWNACHDCVHDGTCWHEIMLHDSNNCDVHYCERACCDNIPGPIDFPKPMCQNNCWRCNENAPEFERCLKHWYFDQHDDFERNVNSHCPGGLVENMKRKRGGGDPANQKRKYSNSSNNRQCNKSSGEKSNSSSCRDSDNARGQLVRRPAHSITNTNQQTERGAMHVDVSVQASATRSMNEAAGTGSFIENIAYRRKMRTMKQYQSYIEGPNSASCSSDAKSPVIQEIDSTLHPLPAIARKQGKGLVTQTSAPRTRCTAKPGVSSCREPRTEPSCRVPTARRDNAQRGKQMTKANNKSGGKLPIAGKSVQCMIIRELRLICGPRDSSKVMDTHVEQLCLCAASVPRTEGDEEQEKLAISSEVTDTPFGSQESDETKDVPAAKTSTSSVTSETEESEKTPVIVDVTEQELAGKDATQQVPEEKDATEQTPVESESAPEETPDPVETVEESDGTGDTIVEVSIPTDKSEEEAADEMPQLDDAIIEEPDISDDKPEEMVIVEEEPANQNDLQIEELTADPNAQAVEPTTQNVDNLLGLDSSIEETVYIPYEKPPGPGQTSSAPDDIAVSSVTDEPEPSSTARRRSLVSKEKAGQPGYQQPVEFIREYKGNRTHVSVEMQTSSTILTKILSEFQIGNKKRQVLMSIKLQTNMDDDAPKEEGSQMRRNGPARRSRRREDPSYNSQNPNRRPNSSKPTSKTRKAYSQSPSTFQSGNDLNEYSDSTTDSTYGTCTGSCGRKKPRYSSEY